MNREEKLKAARNLLLKIHKSMIDLEREQHEGVNGPVTPAEFLNLLIENEDFAWLRKFSMLIVEIDEMFASKDGYPAEMVDVLLTKVQELVDIKEPDEFFRAKYQFALTRDPNSAIFHTELKSLMSQ